MGKETKEKVVDVEEKKTTKSSSKSTTAKSSKKAESNSTTSEKTKKSPKAKAEPLTEVKEEKVSAKKTTTKKKVEAEKEPKTKEPKPKAQKVKEPEVEVKATAIDNPNGDFLSKLGLTKLSAGILAGTMAASIALGVTGIALASGKKGTNGKSAYEIAVENGFTGTEAEWLASLKGTSGATGPQGGGGDTGPQGTSSYIDYMGNVWFGNSKTGVKFDLEYHENVFDNTLAIAGEMSRYFEGSYVDLNQNSIALMNHYQPLSQKTVYSGATVSIISVIAKEAGVLHIGTAKVADVVNARTTGATYTANTTAYNVVAGQNDIVMNLSVASDETVVLGGGSTAQIFMTKGIDSEDELGNFAYIDGDTHSDVLSTTNGDADTLAIKVVASVKLEKAVFEGVTSVACPNTVDDNAAPFVYDNRALFAGKTITEIGMYVKAVSGDASADKFMTVYIVGKNAPSNYRSGTPIKVIVPAAECTVGSWVYATEFRDASGALLDGITLTDNQTLAFGASSGDTIDWGYANSGNSAYNFTIYDGTAGNANLVFDIKTKSVMGYNEQVESIEKIEESAAQTQKELALKQVLNGKKLSILGDSISTFPGWSNNATTSNSTIGSNALYYRGTDHGITDVNKTYWKKVANATGMEVLVDNAWSGDTVAGRGQTRCEQLHDDTGNPDNGVINPDVIVVYLGINDFNGDGGYSNSATFATNYDTMIGKIKAKYPSAQLFVCTLMPNLKSTWTAERNANMLAYNNAIKAAAAKYNATVVDFYNDSGITANNCRDYMSSADSQALHPNETGMTLMANCIWRAMYNKYITTPQG